MESEIYYCVHHSQSLIATLSYTLSFYAFKIIIIRRLTFSFESFGLLNDIFPFYTILDTSCPIFYVQ